jgi:hypothetical protein
MQHRFSTLDLGRATTRDLISELRVCRTELEKERDKFVRPSLQAHIAAVEHMLAIHNARATAQMDGMAEDRLLEIEATLRHVDTSTVPCEVVAELVAEIRRLQGERAMLLPRYMPPAAEDFGAEPVVPPAPDRDEDGNRRLSLDEVAAREHVAADGIKVTRMARRD